MLFFVEGNRLKIRKLGFRGKKKMWMDMKMF